MADDGAGGGAAMLQPRDLLLWVVGSEAEADAFGALADQHHLGAWACYPIGLGRLWYFDLELTRPVHEVTLMLVFGERPQVY